MPRQRAVVQIPVSLAAELDQIAGQGHRSELATLILDQELRRRRLLKIFEHKEPIWKDEDHPELAQGSQAWVRALRQEAEERFQRIQSERQDE